MIPLQLREGRAGLLFFIERRQGHPQFQQRIRRFRSVWIGLVTIQKDFRRFDVLLPNVMGFTQPILGVGRQGVLRVGFQESVQGDLGLIVIPLTKQPKSISVPIPWRTGRQRPGRLRNGGNGLRRDGRWSGFPPLGDLSPTWRRRGRIRADLRRQVGRGCGLSRGHRFAAPLTPRTAQRRTRRRSALANPAGRPTAERRHSIGIADNPNRQPTFQSDPSIGERRRKPPPIGRSPDEGRLPRRSTARPFGPRRDLPTPLASFPADWRRLEKSRPPARPGDSAPEYRAPSGPIDRQTPQVRHRRRPPAVRRSGRRRRRGHWNGAGSRRRVGTLEFCAIASLATGATSQTNQG